jgi:hypothetical protein
MAKYYFPVRNDKAGQLLRYGIDLPKGDDPVIYALASKAAAEKFGKGIFGDQMRMLEIDAELSVYGTGEDTPVGFVAISERVPAAAIGRADGLKYIDEVGRQYFGGRYDDRAINAAAERTYTDIFGRTFQICRELDSEDKPFQLIGPVDPEYRGILPVLEVGGSRHFGSGLSWKAAEEIADKAVGENIAQLRDVPCVYLYPSDEDGSVSVRIRAGLGIGRVEIWEVTQDHIDRGRWGSWLEEPGWHWQRMDVAEIHGPFDSSDAALLDSTANYNEIGILHPEDRPAAAMGR